MVPGPRLESIPPTSPPPLASVPLEASAPTDRPLRDVVKAQVEAVERARIVDALARSAGNQSVAAKLLGMPRRTLVKRLVAYGIPRPRRGPGGNGSS